MAQRRTAKDDEWETIEGDDWETVAPGSEFGARLGLTPSAGPESPGSRFVTGMMETLDPRPLARTAAVAIKAVNPLTETEERRQALKELMAGHSAALERARSSPSIAGKLAWGAAAAVPMIGPAVAGLAEQASSGDVAGALGRLAGMFSTLPVTAGFRLAARKTATPLYGGALKFSERMSLPERSEAIKLGLEARIPVSVKGMSKADAFISEQIAKVDEAIREAMRRGRNRVLMKDVVAPLRELIRHYEETIGAPEAARRARKVLDDALELGDEIPLDKAQQIKQNTYELLQRAYGKEQNPKTEARKVLVHGLRKAIEKEAPEVAELNRRASTALVLKEAIENRLKSDPTWIQEHSKWILAGTGAAGAIMGHQAAVPAALAGIIAYEAVHNPAVMSRLAIALSRGGTGRLSKAINVAPAANLLLGTRSSGPNSDRQPR